MELAYGKAVVRVQWRTKSRGQRFSL